MNFGEQMWCVLSEEMSFETFTPILVLSHVNENDGGPHHDSSSAVQYKAELTRKTAGRAENPARQQTLLCDIQIEVIIK